MAKTEQTPEELKHQLRFDPPSVEFVMKTTEPLRKYFTPEFFGLENVDKDKPALYVHNHTVIGIFDGQLLGAELYKEKDIFLRSLVDNIHMDIPFWRDVIRDVGGSVRGTPENCAELMRRKEHILVFPGGGREVCKKKGEKYKLTWKKRTGFARMAMQFGYPIIPVVGVGGDDTYDIVFDSDDVMNSAVGKFLKKTGIAQKFLKDGEHIPPFVKGVGPTFIPKPVKFYYAIGEPVDTTRFAGQHQDKELQMQVRQEVELSFNKLFLELIAKRDADHEQLPLVRRLLSK